VSSRTRPTSSDWPCGGVKPKFNLPRVMTPVFGLATRTWLLARDSRRGGTHKWSSFPPLTSSRNSTLDGSNNILQCIQRDPSTRIPTCASPSKCGTSTTQSPHSQYNARTHLVKRVSTVTQMVRAFLSHKLHRSIPLLRLRQDQECDRRDTYEPIYRQVRPRWQQRPLQSLYGESLDFQRCHEFSAC